MWATLPPVVSVATAVEELAGVSMAAHMSGMMCEPKDDSSAHDSTSTAPGSRPIALEGSPTVSLPWTKQLPDERPIPLSFSQCEHSHSPALLPSVVSECAACEIPSTAAAVPTGGAENPNGFPHLHTALPSLQRHSQEFSTSQPPVSPPPLGSPVHTTKTPAASASSESWTSRQTAAFPMQHVLGAGLSRSPDAPALMSGAEGEARQCPSLPQLYLSSSHQSQLSYRHTEQPVPMLAEEARAGNTLDAPVAMFTSTSSHDVAKLTNRGSSDVSAGSLQPASTRLAGSLPATAATPSLTDLCWPPPSPAAVATGTSESAAVLIPRDGGRCTLEHHQSPGPLGSQSCSETGASAHEPPPRTSATNSRGGAGPVSVTAPIAVSQQGGGGGVVASLWGANGDNGGPLSTSLAPMSGLPPNPSKGVVGLHGRHAPPLLIWRPSDASSNGSGVSPIPLNAEGPSMFSLSTAPQGQRRIPTHPIPDPVPGSNASAMGHVRFQEPPLAHSSSSLHSSTLKRSSLPGSGEDRASVLQGSLLLPTESSGFAGPRRHSESFYTGTPGNDSLRRSFFFPSKTSGRGAAPVDGAGVAQAMTPNGAWPVHDMTSHLHFSVSARGGSLEQATPSAAAGGSILADSYCSPTQLDSPPFPVFPHSCQGQGPFCRPLSRIPNSLLNMPLAPVRAPTQPEPYQNTVSHSHHAAPRGAAPLHMDSTVEVSDVPRMDRHGSQSLSPGLLPLLPSDWQSFRVGAAHASASETGCNTVIQEASLVSPTLACSLWRSRFEESFSSSDEAFTHRDSQVPMPTSTATTLADCGGRGGVSARLPLSTPIARPTPAPAYILDWELSLTAFKERAESYYTFKGVCTETYLTLIEHSVDRFLVSYFDGGGGGIGPKESLQGALASNTGATARATPDLLGDTYAVRVDAVGSNSPGAGGGGIQKMLQGGKTLQRLGETGSRWLVRMGANLRRTGVITVAVPSASQTALMRTSADHQDLPTLGNISMSPQQDGEGDFASSYQVDPAAVDVVQSASSETDNRVPKATYERVCNSDPFGVPSAAHPALEEPHAPAANGAASLPNTSQLSLTLSAHPELVTEVESSASSSSLLFESRVSPEEAEIQCLRQLGPYVANVIPDTFMDSPPSDGVLHQVRCNYAILLYTLQHVLTDGSNRSRQGSVSDSLYTDRNPPLPVALSHTLNPVFSTRFESPPSLTLDELICQRIRQGLLLPTIQTTWRDYLTPLRSKVHELVQIASVNIDPILEELQAECNHGIIDDSTSRPAVCSTSPGGGLQCDSTTATAFSSKGETTSSRVVTDTERAAREALRAAWEVPLTRLIRLLRRDEEYLSTINTMDNEFLENGTAWRLRSAQMRMRCASLSDYVPVYGLSLSRLHRLEVEHRTVLELWGGRDAAASTGRQ